MRIKGRAWESARGPAGSARCHWRRTTEKRRGWQARGLREAGHSVLVVEHQLDVIAAADWVIDLGPGGGREGGRLVAEGPPGEVAMLADSPTGRALARRFARHLSDKKPA